MSHPINRRQRGLLLLTALVAFVLCSAVTAQEAAKKSAAAPPPKARAPLDPLSADERRRAERVAQGDARVSSLVGAGRVRMVYVELTSDKPEGEPRAGTRSPSGRFAEVLQYRYDDDSGVRTLVDLQRNEVRAVERVEGSAVPLTRQDLDEAVKLALSSGEVKELLGREAGQYVAPPPSAPKNPPYAIRPLLVHAVAENDPCYRRRCVQLFFQSRGAYLIDSAIVDLTERGVRIERGAR